MMVWTDAISPVLQSDPLLVPFPKERGCAVCGLLVRFEDTAMRIVMPPCDDFADERSDASSCVWLVHDRCRDAWADATLERTSAENNVHEVDLDLDRHSLILAGDHDEFTKRSGR
jgi:hypothetical protein